MLRYFVVVAAVVSFVAGFDAEEQMDTIEIISHWGYEAEEHIAETEDGWLLKLHRIPRGKNDKNDGTPKPVVILQHGIQCSSDNWVLNSPEQSAGFVFADAGYDVWLTNSRGNVYSKHKNYTRADKRFWRFTNDDMQQYDLPAVFDLIENVTNQSQFYYVGHSQGTYIMFLKLATDPSFKNRVKKFFALGPAMRFKDISGPFKYVCASMSLPYISAIWDQFAYTEFASGLLSQNMVNILTELTCSASPEQNLYCANIFYYFTGFSTQLNVSRIPVYLHHIPAGTSTANVQKCCQSGTYETGEFRWYRYPTEEENVARYGTKDPPKYDLKKMDVPLYLYSANEDTLTTKKQLEEDIIPNLKPGILKEDNRYEHFSHMDLIWGQNATDQVFNKIISTIKADLQ
ncbi:unnamed protein product [Bursaphelenchus okinawaensis]|uniref:Lipase n=1 Tax=Bursaphelenchus okinawaensis TaxID=465554 RepID=A0A811KU67_9BILA|nr:unnamed protein product [Bursaphelenchus okinawaensis]CAG9111995.1 unnamed protein product [Bursaphelenchus okinawaensis]